MMAFLETDHSAARMGQVTEIHRITEEPGIRTSEAR